MKLAVAIGVAAIALVASFVAIMLSSGRLLDEDPAIDLQVSMDFGGFAQLEFVTSHAERSGLLAVATSAGALLFAVGIAVAIVVAVFSGVRLSQDLTAFQRDDAIAMLRGGSWLAIGLVLLSIVLLLGLPIVDASVAPASSKADAQPLASPTAKPTASPSVTSVAQERDCLAVTVAVVVISLPCQASDP